MGFSPYLKFQEKSSTANATLWAIFPEVTLLTLDTGNQATIIACYGKTTDIYFEQCRSIMALPSCLGQSTCSFHVLYTRIPKTRPIPNTAAIPSFIIECIPLNNHLLGYSFSFFRCRRLISPSIDVDINCSGLTSSSLAGSMEAVASSGTRDTGFRDLFFAVITKDSCRWWALLFLMVDCRQSFGLLRCSDFSLRPQASSTHAEKLAEAFSVFSRSTLASISSIRSWGKRIPLNDDLLFLLPVAIAIPNLSNHRVYTLYRETYKIKSVDMFTHLRLMCLHTYSFFKGVNNETPQCSNTYGVSHQNVNRGNTMAAIQSTQTHPKFTPHFPMLNSSDTKSVLSLRRPINKKLLTEAQSWVRNNPGTWIWKLAVHKAKEAYGIIEPEPCPDVGDTNGNYICTYSNHDTGEYTFLLKRREVCHA